MVFKSNLDFKRQTQLLILVLVLITSLFSKAVEGQSKKSNNTVNIRPEHGFRVVPWCINGADEPEFRRYPLTDFKPLLDRHFKFIRGNTGFRYEVDLYKIQVEDQKIGDSEYLQNIAHFRFRSRKQRFFEDSVYTEFVENDLEGLIIQMVHAPLGVGLPTGTFLDELDINCFDCQYPLGQIVGCKKKTWLNLMHPTVLVFHHKMKVSPTERNRTKAFCEDQTIQKYCKGIVNDTSKCDVDSNCVSGDKCQRPPPTYVCFEEGGEKIAMVNGAEIPCTDPNGEPDNSKCSSTTDPPQECEQKIVDPKPNVDCKSMGKYYGKTSEVHGNIAWFNHPCHYTNKVRFLYLAVHSFNKGLYSILTTGEFDLPVTKGTEHNSYIPSPIFTGLRHDCEPSTPKSRKLNGGKLNEELTPEIANDLVKLDYSFTYDDCIRTLGDNILETFCMYNSTEDGKVAGGAPKVSVKGKPFTAPQRCIKHGKANDDKRMDHTVKDLVPSCSAECEQLPTTTTILTTLPPEPFIKRSLHGGINLVTNFCIMPVCVFIARFYKETFNLQTIKGAKTWYWMHLIGAGGSSVLMYIGYFHKSYVQDSDPHVYFGNTYILFLALAYVSSWIRHKSERLTIIAETIHGAAGYSCFFLALCCMHTVPSLGIYPIVFVYISVSFLGLFYIGMTCAICKMDKKMGMQPRRRHFPTVEAKFDELPIPKRQLRIIYLIVLSVTIFLLTLGTIFF